MANSQSGFGCSGCMGGILAFVVALPLTLFFLFRIATEFTVEWNRWLIFIIPAIAVLAWIMYDSHVTANQRKKCSVCGQSTLPIPHEVVLDGKKQTVCGTCDIHIRNRISASAVDRMSL